MGGGVNAYREGVKGEREGSYCRKEQSRKFAMGEGVRRGGREGGGDVGFAGFAAFAAFVGLAG